MWNKKQVKEVQQKLTDIAAPLPKVGLLEKLRKERKSKLDAAIQLDKDIEALDREITHIERHPGSEEVLQHFADQNEAGFRGFART